MLRPRRWSVEQMKPGSVIVDIAAEQGRIGRMARPAATARSTEAGDVTRHGVHLVGGPTCPAGCRPTAPPVRAQPARLPEAACDKDASALQIPPGRRHRRGLPRAGAARCCAGPDLEDHC